MIAISRNVFANYSPAAPVPSSATTEGTTDAKTCKLYSKGLSRKLLMTGGTDVEIAAIHSRIGHRLKPLVRGRMPGRTVFLYSTLRPYEGRHV
jgi:hypothetical protein